MSDNFVKIIDFSLLPFSLVILGKVLGLFVVISSLNISWGIADLSGNFISASPVIIGGEITKVATYSNLVLFLIILIGILFQLLSLRIQSIKDLSVKIELFLEKVKLGFLVPKSRLPFLRLGVWLFFYSIVVLYIFVDTFIGNTQLWLAISVLIVSVIVIAQASIEFSSQIKLLNDVSNLDFSNYLPRGSISNIQR